MMLRRLILLAGLWFAALGIVAPGWAVTLAVKQVLGPPGWVLPLNPDLQFDFARAAAWKGTGTGGGAVVPPESLLTVTRASAATINDLAGNWREWPANTLAQSNRGITPWEARINSVRNNSMQGAVAGTPGTLPTNWLSPTLGTGLTMTVVGTGVENGIDYIDLRLFGTCTAGGSAGTQFIAFDGTAQLAALYGQTWTYSLFAKLQAGSFANVTSLLMRNRQMTSGGAPIADITTSPSLLTATGAPLGSQRFIANGGSTAPTTAFIWPWMSYGVTQNVPVDFTLRLGWVQEENNNIDGTVASAAIVAGGVAYVNGDTITLAGGTGTASVLTVTNAIAGVIQAGGVSVANAGSYSVMPPSPAAQGSTSGIGTGATFTLTPTNNAAKGFATSPIRTTSAAAQRAADTIQFPIITGTSISIFANATPSAPTTLPFDQSILSIGVSDTDGIRFYRRNATANGKYLYGSGGAVQTNNSVAAWAQNTAGKLAMAAQSGDQAGSFNGAAPFTTSQTGLISTRTAVYLDGNYGSGVRRFSGYISSLAIWPTARLSNEVLQDLTR